MTRPDKVVHEGNGVYALWRYNDTLGFYCAVWPDEDATLGDTIRRVSMTRKDEGHFVGCYFYTR